MVFALHVAVMSSAFFNPSFAFSSHFDTDGASLSELSWPSSVAVVAVSFSGLFTFVFLMLACLCCKKGDIGFKEFENTERDGYQADRSALASPSSQNGPEVYILPLTEVSLPVSKQPGRSIQLLKSSDLGRHSLLYLKEIGHGWFGRVLLGEVSAGLNSTQVVVKELKASSSVQDQMQFLEENQPYQTLQHPALLQCLSQCLEVTPYLLVMEFCPLGDLKTYLRSCQAADSETPDTLILQRMACDIASGLLHLHKNNFIHSDLALRNCLLTSEMSVKIGDYGLSHSRFKDDYYITQDQIWVPLRWIAPELIDEVHGNLLVVDQTKSSNIWSLGVTLWELFELGNQPFRQYSDRQVLTYAVKEQQLKLPKPQLELPLSDRWYEVLQFCWLQPELRPSSEEVHLLVTYLCAKGSSEAEEDFELRWNALKPNLLCSPSHTAASTTPVLTPKSASAGVPIAEQTQAVELASSASSSFPLLEGFSDSFPSDTGDDLLTVTETSHGLNFEYKWEQARSEQPYCSSYTSGPLGQGNPHYQDIYYSSGGRPSEGCGTESISPPYYKAEHTAVVPVLSAHSPSVSSEYYIRIEEPMQCNMKLDNSPGPETINCRLSTRNSSMPQSYWSTAENTESNAYDSDLSPAVQPKRLTSTSPISLSQSDTCLSPSCSETFHSKRIVNKTRCQSCLDVPYDSNFDQSESRLENPRSLSQAVSSPSLGFCDPYLERSSGCCSINETSVDMTLRKTLPVVPRIDVETGDGLLLGRRRSGETEDDLFSEAEATNWISNHSANNNSLSFDSRQSGSGYDSYLNFQSNSTELWSLTKATTKTFHNSKPFAPTENRGDSCKAAGIGSYIHLCHKEEEATRVERCLNVDLLQSENSRSPEQLEGEYKTQSLLNRERMYSEMRPEESFLKSLMKHPSDKAEVLSNRRGNLWEVVPAGLSVGESDSSRAFGVRNSSSCMVELGDCSEDDLADITSGIFADFNLDYAEMEEEEELTPKKNPERSPDSVDTINPLSSMGSSYDQTFSPDPFGNPIFPKSLDSGYDTENNESPEFIFKELGGEMSPILGGDPAVLQQVGSGQYVCTSISTSQMHVKGMAGKNPCRDSAYFSDYDAECEKSPHEEGIPRKHSSPAESFSGELPAEKHVSGKNVTNLRDVKSCVVVNLSEADCPSPYSFPAPGLSMLSPFPPQMGGCLTKESAPADDDLGLESEHSGDEPASELSSCVGSDNSSSAQNSSANPDEENCSADQSSGCTTNDCKKNPRETGEGSTEEEELSDYNHASDEADDTRECARINEEDFEDIDAEECDSLYEETNGPHDLSTSSSLLELCGEDVRAPLEVGEDEEDSDDSESDEELRTYNIQDEDSEESEEDFSTVPVVVSDCSRARHLRSLLKMPTLLTQSFCDELERKKKAVSFFDDVTVYLFDQESPTGELADFSLSSDAEEGQQESSESELDPELCESFCVSKEINSDDGGSCTWENEESFESSPSSPPSDPEPDPAASSIASSPEAPKPAAVTLNRFMGSRFSITHVFDQHASSAAGNSQDEMKN
ncbi:serine/threonine-protein kinase LMTK1 isoform X2 [Oryzias melastigma]|uniref:non-specific serine/threonine protein kinase n=1 Tax=Oryzias melastigma TaxID=30732 RepID=A0A3B3D7Z0_ORYME|nr:serine/threonine-protein kinase LMTK1 isoform X2 [Oryzias melastigma]